MVANPQRWSIKEPNLQALQVTDFTAIKEVIELTSKGGDVDFYSLHQHYRLSPGRILCAVEELRNSDLITLEQGKLYFVAPKSLEQLAFIRSSYIKSHKPSALEFIPKHSSDITDDYIPVLSMLDAELIKDN